MMLRVAISMSCLVICSICVAAAADLPAPDGALMEPAVFSVASTSVDAPASARCASGGDFESYCVADCGEYPDVSCNGGVCSAVNRNCSIHQRGYVVCDGAYTYCPACPECEDGEYWFLGTGDCCFEGREQVEVYKCINEQWVFQRLTCRPSPECPFYP